MKIFLYLRKQKLTSNIGFFLEFFPQLILTTGSQNMGPDITVYYGIWAHVSTKTAGALLSDVIHKVNSVQNEGHEPHY